MPNTASMSRLADLILAAADQTCSPRSASPRTPSPSNCAPAVPPSTR